jgi:hypothetical protein
MHSPAHPYWCIILASLNKKIRLVSEFWQGQLEVLDINLRLRINELKWNFAICLPWLLLNKVNETHWCGSIPLLQWVALKCLHMAPSRPALLSQERPHVPCTHTLADHVLDKIPMSTPSQSKETLLSSRWAPLNNSCNLTMPVVLLHFWQQCCSDKSL